MSYLPLRDFFEIVEDNIWIDIYNEDGTIIADRNCTPIRPGGFTQWADENPEMLSRRVVFIEMRLDETGQPGAVLTLAYDER